MKLAESVDPKTGLTDSQSTQLSLLKEQLFSQNRQIQQLRHNIEEIKNIKRNENNNTYLIEAKRNLESKIFSEKQHL